MHHVLCILYYYHDVCESISSKTSQNSPLGVWEFVCVVNDGTPKLGAVFEGNEGGGCWSGWWGTLDLDHPGKYSVVTCLMKAPVPPASLRASGRVTTAHAAAYNLDSVIHALSVLTIWPKPYFDDKPSRYDLLGCAWLTVVI